MKEPFCPSGQKGIFIVLVIVGEGLAPPAHLHTNQNEKSPHKQTVEVKRYKSFPRRLGEGVSAADR